MPRLPEESHASAEEVLVAVCPAVKRQGKIEHDLEVYHNAQLGGERIGADTCESEVNKRLLQRDDEMNPISIRARISSFNAPCLKPPSMIC